MAPRPKTVPTYLSLKAKISSCDFSYHANQNDTHAFSDLIALNINAIIESIDTRFGRHLGKDVQVSLSAAGRGSLDSVADDGPMLFPINLRGESRSLSGVIPSDALLALPNLIDSGRISFIWAWFEPPRHGYGNVRSIALLSEREIENY